MVHYQSLDNDKHYLVQTVESENVHLRNMTAFALNSSAPRLSVLPPSSGHIPHIHVVRLTRKLTDTKHVVSNYTKAESHVGRQLELPEIATRNAESHVGRQLELPENASSKPESQVVRQLELPEIATRNA